MKKIVIFISFLSFGIFFIFGSSNIVYADKLTVGPDKFLLEMHGGENKTLSFFLSTNSNTSEKINILLKSFEQDNSGNVYFEEDLYEEIRTLITKYDQSFVINSGETKQFDLELNIPKDFVSGNYKFSVIFQNQNLSTENSTDSSAVFKIAVPVILNINDAKNSQFSEKLEINKFELTNPIFSLDQKLNLIINLKNLGNSSLKPSGVINLKKVFGIGSDEYNLDFNNDKKIILPSGERLFNIDLNLNGFTFGKYCFSINIIFGGKNQIESKTIELIIMPIWFLLLMVFILFSTIMFFLFKLRRKK